MNWARTKLDQLLGWYSSQSIWIKLLCVLPVVVGVAALVCLCLVTIGSKVQCKQSVSEAIHTEAKTIIVGLDTQLREASAKIRTAQAKQTKIGEHLEQVATDTQNLQERVAEMSHDELKLHMEEARCKNALPTHFTISDHGYYADKPEIGMSLEKLKSRVTKSKP